MMTKRPTKRIPLHSLTTTTTTKKTVFFFFFFFFLSYFLPHRSTTKDQTGRIEHIGEWEPILDDGTCSNRFLIPSKNGTGCVLPARFDVASHYMRSGGRAGFKEAYDALVSRILSYNKFLFGDFEETLTKVPALKSLFKAKGYLKVRMGVMVYRKERNKF
jgi:hypothetical protein